jgi:hypothetical protein
MEEIGEGYEVAEMVDDWDRICGEKVAPEGVGIFSQIVA